MAINDKFLTDYLKNVEKDKGSGEHNLRQHLLKLLKDSFLNEYDFKDEPNKGTEVGYGKPDIDVSKGNVRIGKIETKDYKDNIQILFDQASQLYEKGDFNGKEEKYQIAKYMRDYKNLILTNFIDFALINNKNGELTIKHYKLDSTNIIKSVNEILSCFKVFLNGNLELSSPEDIATTLANIARELKDKLLQAENDFREKSYNNKKSLFSLIEKYIYNKDIQKMRDSNQKTEVDELYKQFVDDYVQILSYGYLFSKLIKNKEITPEEMALKGTNLRIIESMFNKAVPDGSLIDVLPESKKTIEELIDAVNNINVEKLKESLFGGLKDAYGTSNENVIEDPFIYLFETFLEKYDKIKKKNDGSFYTPIPVVKFITKSVDEILEKDLGYSKGLGNKNIWLLDFATGTGTFLAEAYNVAMSKYVNPRDLFPEKQKDNNQGIADKKISVRFAGFDIQMASYMITQMKLWALIMEKTNMSRVIPSAFITDTLDYSGESYNPDTFQSLGGYETPDPEPQLYYMKTVADGIKNLDRGYTINVIVGNPPYNSLSKNQSPFINNLMKTYKEGLKEKKQSGINDDYVKFIRLAHNIIKKNGSGVVGLITNNSFIDGPTMRIMRQKLIQDFNKIYIINLHGNQRKEPSDENVFDIKVGTCISIFVLDPALNEHNIYYFSTKDNKITKRKEKFQFLANNTVKTINFEKVSPVEPMYYFIPFSIDNKYQESLSLPHAFKEYKSGIKTSFDDLFVDFDIDNLKNKMIRYFDYNNTGIKNPDNLKGYKFFDYNTKAMLFNKVYSEKETKPITQILYRPFDIRTIYYDKDLITTKTARPSYKIMKHMLSKDNIALVASRQTPKEKSIFMSKNVCDLHAIADLCIFPLYVYSSNNNKSINLTDDFLTEIKSKYGDQFPETTFYYIYGLLSSKEYFEKYKDQMRQDFPHVILVDSKDKFLEIAKYGEELADININFQTIELPDDFNVEVNVENKSLVSDSKNSKIKFNYDEKAKTLYVETDKNKVTIKNLEPEVWNFKLGNFDVLRHYIYSRKDRDLNEFADEIRHICYAIKKNIEITEKIKIE